MIDFDSVEDYLSIVVVRELAFEVVFDVERLDQYVKGLMAKLFWVVPFQDEEMIT